MFLVGLLIILLILLLAVILILISMYLCTNWNHKINEVTSFIYTDPTPLENFTQALCKSKRIAMQTNGLNQHSRKANSQQSASNVGWPYESGVLNESFSELVPLRKGSHSWGCDRQRSPVRTAAHSPLWLFYYALPLQIHRKSVHYPNSYTYRIVGSITSS